MTRAYALQQLLALGGLTEPEVREICGWPQAEVRATLADLLRAKVVTYLNCGRGMRVYRLA